MIRPFPGFLLLILFACMLSPTMASAQPSFACPEGTKFWEEQCAQDGSKKVLICRAGVENLWRCVITETDVVQWKKNDGSFETTASLAALSNANLFVALCSQLMGPDIGTAQDAAESEYLALMLNLCSGALPLDVQASKDGVVSTVIDSFEQALNTGQDLDLWQKVVKKINTGAVEAPRCPDPESLFRNIPPC